MVLVQFGLIIGFFELLLHFFLVQEWFGLEFQFLNWLKYNFFQSVFLFVFIYFVCVFFIIFGFEIVFYEKKKIECMAPPV